MREKVCLILGSMLILYYLICGLYGGFRLSVLWIWLAAGVLCVGIGLGWFNGAWARVPDMLRTAAYVACILFLTAFILTEAMVISCFHAKGEKDLDYVIVLGAAVKGTAPSNALTYRIEAACRYMRENPRTKAIVSGGQGPGEDISEAECMKREMVRRGIPASRLQKEDQSVSTSQNIRFSYRLIGDNHARVGIVSSNFHVWRAVEIAKKQGPYAVCPIAAAYPSLLLPHYVVREFLTVTVDKAFGNL